VKGGEERPLDVGGEDPVELGLRGRLPRPRVANPRVVDQNVELRIAPSGRQFGVEGFEEPADLLDRADVGLERKRFAPGRLDLVSWASRLAMARPIPREPPVTTATLSLSLLISRDSIVGVLLP
jgi:hypothetical protein